MRIYFKNIYFPNSYIENKINEKFNKITEKKYIYIFSPDGIFRFNGDKLEKLYEKYNQNAKYDINSYDTIFNQNVDVKYLDNNIIGQYLDVSINRNTLIMSKDVIYKNPKNILTADVVEMNIKTKDTKIYMHDSKKKVNIKSKN